MLVGTAHVGGPGFAEGVGVSGFDFVVDGTEVAHEESEFAAEELDGW